MFVKRLSLINFRGFKKIDFDFPSKLAVLIGVNGSGKTSILDACAILLTQLESRIREIKPRGSNTLTLSEDDINFETDEAHCSIVVETHPGLEIAWSVSKTRNSNNSKVSSSYVGLETYTHKILDEFNLNPLTPLPVLLYYKTNRQVFDSKPSNFKNPIPSSNFPTSRLKAYQGAFSAKITDFQDFFEWFKNEEDYENEIRLRQDTNYRSPNLEVIRVALEKFLQNFSGFKYSNLHVVRSSGESEIRRISAPTLVVSKDGQDIKLEKLSEGEKMLLMLVADLARRLSMLNPSSINPEISLNGSGIVLIDEIDLHLHPQWQRTVIQSLLSTFPGIQFITTSHSPQTLSNVQKENVFIIEDWEVVEKTPYTYGKDSNSILYELMDVPERPKEIKEQLDECFRLIDTNEFEAAREALSKLEILLGPEDPEITRAQTIINFMTEVE
jgi:predicted ATP-binding protein involved in virulence